MATILIVEDHAMSRQMLKALFGYLGYRVLEAADGSAGLALARSEHPDLVISDVAMPTMDGFELIRLMRAESSLEKTPCIFYTATYRVSEAQKKSEEIVACRVIPKPSDPLFIFQSASEMLGLAPPDVSMPVADHLKAALPESDPLRTAGLQLATLMDLSFHLAGQKDPARLLDIFCRATREILRCGQILLGLRANGRTRYFAGSGEQEPVYVCPTNLIPIEDILERVMTERKTFRRNRLPAEGGSTEPLLRESGTASLESLFIIPFATPGRVYGWLCVADKLDRTVFRDEDEEMATALSSQAAIAYENIMGHEELERKVLELERAVEQLNRKEEALKKISDRLRNMAIRISEVEENDRARLAREIHDSIGSNLTSLSMSLSAVESDCGAASGDALRERLGDSLRLVKETMAHAREIMAELRPPVLDEYGLLAALHWYADEYARRTGITVNVRGKESAPRLSSATETGLFRIVQEALNNTAKHAKAANVLVTLKPENKLLQLIIIDDGVGFDVSNKLTKSGGCGWGLTIMTERAEALGGRLGVQSEPDRGTKIIVEVPQ